MSSEKLLNHAWIALMIVLIFLLVPTMQRDAPFLDSGLDRLKVQGADSGLVVRDAFLSEDVFLITTPYDVLVNYLRDFIPYEILILYLPIVFGLLSLILFYPTLRKNYFAKSEITVLYLLAGLTPSFIAFFTFNHAFSFAYFLLAFFFFCYDRVPLLSLISLILLAGFGPIVFVGSLIFFFLLKGINKKTILQSIIPIGMFIWHSIAVQSASFIDVSFSLRNISSEVGSFIAVGSFLYVLAGVGFTHAWKRNKVNLLILLSGIVLSLFIAEVVFITLPMLLYLATKGLFKVAGQHWKIDLLKQATIFALLLGILFSSISYEDRITKELPSEDYLEGMDWLIKNTPSSSVVLTDPSRGSIVEVYAQRRVVFNHHYGSDELQERLFHSYDLDAVRSALEEYDVSYIVVDDVMKKGLVWERENQELLFLLTDERYFTSAYENDQVVIFSFER